MCGEGGRDAKVSNSFDLNEIQNYDVRMLSVVFSATYRMMAHVLPLALASSLRTEVSRPPGLGRERNLSPK